ncbi:YaeQ family protein [Endozoicomonas arenosclerae]|uniref:YaeQ family protein n=1 Tax=Endozoicomonas arenosclerae TaxID=1633495 RepID=UPI00078077F1|nr:YaeQ family protein [Endozoicomonas arenosclerae]
MALKATIFKTELQIADMDRHYYQNHSLTIARHPSENDERMMIRVLAFTLFADEQLSFTKGLSTDDEPDLWLKNYSDEIELWIDLGQPDEKRIRKACGRAQSVVLINYGGRTSNSWWEQMSGKLDRFQNLKVLNLPEDSSKALAELAARNMQISASIQDGHIMISDERHSLDITLEKRKD